MAVASIVSDLTAEKPGVLPAMSRPLINKLPRVSLRLLRAAFLFCNIFVPPYVRYELYRNSSVYLLTNRKVLARPHEPLAMEDVAGLRQHIDPYGLCWGVFASR